MAVKKINNGKCLTITAKIKTIITTNMTVKIKNTMIVNKVTAKIKKRDNESENDNEHESNDTNDIRSNEPSPLILILVHRPPKPTHLPSLSHYERVIDKAWAMGPRRERE